MYQAGYKYSENWEEIGSSEPETRVRVVRKTYKKVNNKRRFIIKTGVLLLMYAFVLVYFCIKSATLGYQILSLENNIQQIETTNKRLEFQIAEKSSLQRIEKVAAKELGMYNPDATQDVAVTAQPQTGNAANQHENITKAKTAEKPLEKFYSALRVLAQKDNN